MSSTDPLTPTEQALLEYLRALREQPPVASAGLADSVIRVARWQAVARPYLIAGGMLASAVAKGLGLLLGDARARP